MYSYNSSDFKNIYEISKKLDRDVKQIAKYYGKYISTQTRINKMKEMELSGIFDSKSLTNVIKSFIDDEVLCSECGNPETFIREIKKNKKEKCCKACGYKEKYNNK